MVIYMHNNDINKRDREIISELAKKYAEIAAHPKMALIKKRMTDSNSLREVRPVVLIGEVPWHELNIDDKLTCHCKSSLAIEMESFFRRALLQWEYFPCDRYYEPYYPLSKTVIRTGSLTIEEDVLIKDSENYIISHAYHDQLQNFEDIEKLVSPVINTDPALDSERLTLANELLNGALPVRLCGMSSLYYAPWDEIPRLHGITNTLIDLVDRPDFMHAIMKRFTDNQLSVMDQYEKLELLDPMGETHVHLTPVYADELPAPDYKSGPYRLKDVWFRSMAQLFGDVSPALHKEFDIDYSTPMFKRCGLGYYGCCEALDTKIDMIKKIPNIRKIGISAWANVTVCAEQIGNAYVFAHKPNPATVAIKTEPEVVRREIAEVLDAARQYDLRCEFVLKDISTSGYDINNLALWDKTVREVIDEYYR